MLYWRRPRPWLAAVVAVFLILSFFTFDQIEEDAFIHLRVVENLAAGDGYVFNPGGERIETGTNVLWQFLLVPFAFAPWSLLLTMKLLGIAFGSLAIVWTHRLARLVIEDPALRLAPPAFLAVSAPFYMWSQRGLGTALVVCVLLWLCAAACEKRLERLWPLAALATLLVRPEGLLMLAALLPYVWGRRASSRFHWELGALAAAGVLLVVARLVYFHDPVVFPFYLKGEHLGLRFGVRMAWDFLSRSHLGWLLVPAAAGLFRRDTWNRAAVQVAAFAVLTAAWGVASPEGKPFNRHLVPALPFIFLLAVRCLERWALPFSGQRALRLALLVFGAVLMLAPQLPASRSLSRNPLTSAVAAAWHEPGAFAARLGHLLTRPEAEPAPPALAGAALGPIGTNTHATLGKFVARNYPAGITLAYDQMGQTPWYAGRDKPTIDTLGLTDRTVGYWWFYRRAHRSRLRSVYADAMGWLAGRLWPEETRRVSDAQVLDHVFESEPELVIVNRVLLRVAIGRLPAILLGSPRLRERYRLAWEVNGIAHVYERRDLRSPEPVHVPEGARVRRLAATTRRGER